MKTKSIQMILAVLTSTVAFAKPPRNPEKPPPPMIPPLFAVIDTDKNGVLSEKEIQAAADAILKLDQNGDHEVSLEEIHLPPPPPIDGHEAPQNPPHGKRPPPPVIAALDVDQDGTISVEEMKNAPESLKALDHNHDGQLTPDELHPPPPHYEQDEQGPPPEDSPQSGADAPAE
ncbi:MAG: hypothetical protein H8M99_08215 [Gloeobacteraceae cyanobacterium ES-bin-144]|nr:hypothetical protein [Verrucomicrobiales bacterium]